jgi:hypothetical protein
MRFPAACAPAAVLGRRARQVRGAAPAGRPIVSVIRSGFGLHPAEPAQTIRLARFRQAHPDVIVGDGGFGTVQARIPEPDGETVITRYTLRELLDRLDELTGPAGQGSHSA